MAQRTMRAAKITPENLDVVILQDRLWLALWCGPRKRKLGHWFVYRKRKTLSLRARIYDVSREATFKELLGFVRT